MTSSDEATRRAVSMGLDPRGFPAEPTGVIAGPNPVAVPDGVDFLPWGSAAADAMHEGYSPLCLLDWLIELAADEGRSLCDYLGMMGIGPEALDPEDF